MQTSNSTRTTVPAAWPCLTYRDARAAIRFLVEGLGLTERVVYGEGDRVDHAELTWTAGDTVGGVMLGSPRGEHDATTQRLGSGTVYLVLDGPDEGVDALFARALAAGATVLRPLENPDYGGRIFSVRDAEGNVWSVGTWYE